MHPGVGAVSMHCEIQPRANGQNWNHTYLETDPKRLVAFLFTMLKACALVETACFNCFESRLKLDAELVRMRCEFDICNRQTATIIAQIINWQQP